MSTMQQQRNGLQSGLAKGSLGLGIASLLGILAVIRLAIQFAIQGNQTAAMTTIFAGVFTGLPAILTGLKAERQARTQAGQFGGRKLALAGITLGSLTMLVTLLLIPVALQAKKEIGRQINAGNCAGNLMSVGRALQVYAIDNGTYPDDLLKLNGLLRRPEKLWCAGDTNRSPTTNWAAMSAANVTFELLQPLGTEADNQRRAVLRCPIHTNEWWGDGSLHMRNRTIKAP